MRGFGVLCFIFVCSLTAFADEYVKFDSLPKTKRIQWARQSQATLPLQFETNMNCSSVLVGPNGEALTNLHCVEHCLVAAGAVTEEAIPGSSLKKMLVQANQLPVKCKLSFNKKGPPSFVDTEIRHVFGPGWIRERDDFNEFLNASPEGYLKLANEGFESGGDLVLIQLPIEENDCMTLASAPFKGPSPVDVVSVAYPLVYRVYGDMTYAGMGTSTLMTFGRTQLWSQGQASGQRDTLLEVLSADYLKWVDLLIPNNLIVASTDTEHGASGSPLFDLNGKVVAITRSTWKGESLRYVPWTSGALDITPHKQWLTENIKGIEKCH